MSRQYEVPKLSVQIALVLSDGSEITGDVFLAENQLSYTGHPRLEDFLNNVHEPFFPCHTNDDRVLLIHKHRLVYLRSSERDSDVLENRLMLEPRKVLARLNNGHELSGVIYSSLPKEHSRVSDFFNQRDEFLPLYQEQDKIILNKSMVVWVED